MNRENNNIADFFSRQVSFFFFPLIAPVSLTLLSAVATSNVLISSTGSAPDAPQPLFASQNTTYYSESSCPITKSLVNVLAFVALITLSTFLLLALYKCGCTKLLYGWLLYSSASLLLVMTWIWVRTILMHFGIPYTILSLGIFVWNFGTVGILSIFFYAHPIFRQGYLIFASLLMIDVLLQLPESTGWLLLVAAAFYDLFAVLCPVGPLRLLVEESNQRRDPLPGFVYDAEDTLRRIPPAADMEPSREEELSPLEHHLLSSKLVQRSCSMCPGKLGLGDFIFFGLLVGLASQRGFAEWTFVFFAILLGMVTTFFTLLFNRHRIPAFPALPFSIFLGTFVYISARSTVSTLAVFVSIEGLLL